ncbi:bacterial transferase hexapeptide domain protein [Geobacillus proteiniphilus]|uniref:Bacterial transferase hexapeptide domain protein n=1 Tax=Geobacillus proteiniphilus TaxID=860353 RepID=A0A1Q5T6Z6_9BACL|nr:bacterial transferase hexapeptide domain protein [Geobacillus proteiniphilus]
MLMTIEFCTCKWFLAVSGILGTVVHQDVPPGAMAAGCPMRIVRTNKPPSD